LKIFYSKYSTPIKTIHLYADEEHLIGVSFTPLSYESIHSINNVLHETISQLNEYFSNRRQYFDLPLKIAGTSFQKSVWKRLQKIPYGKTKSYMDIANEIRSENSCRAVGTANGKNHFPIIIPCHRVIKANGEIGGYAGGIEFKKVLLELEKRPL
jgi:methylated-DNA-[protein]-cysteine S-methyltransferase